MSARIAASAVLLGLTAVSFAARADLRREVQIRHVEARRHFGQMPGLHLEFRAA